jgi:hypothetical protein
MPRLTSPGARAIGQRGSMPFAVVFLMVVAGFLPRPCYTAQPQRVHRARRTGTRLLGRAQLEWGRIT